MRSDVGLYPWRWEHGMMLTIAIDAEAARALQRLASMTSVPLWEATPEERATTDAVRRALEAVEEALRASEGVTQEFADDAAKRCDTVASQGNT